MHFVSIRVKDDDLEIIKKAQIIEKRNRSNFFVVAAVEKAKNVLKNDYRN